MRKLVEIGSISSVNKVGQGWLSNGTFFENIAIFTVFDMVCIGLTIGFKGF